MPKSLPDSEMHITAMQSYERQAFQTVLPWRRRRLLALADRARIFGRLAQLSERLDGFERARSERAE